MIIKKLLVLAVIPIMCLTAHAQQSKSIKDFSPKKGAVTMAVTVGYNNYANVEALPGTLTAYEASAMSTNWNDKKLMVGFEMGWFIKDAWKLNWGGGFNFTSNPGYSAVPGTMDETNSDASVEDNLGEVPYYRAVANVNSISYAAHIGMDHYFRMNEVPNLMLFLGVRAGFAYGSQEKRYDEYVSMGKSSAETWDLRGSVTLGIDYYVLPAMFIGLQVEPVAYTYNMTSYKPQEGLGRLSADSHNIGFVAAPTLKIGFKF